VSRESDSIVDTCDRHQLSPVDKAVVIEFKLKPSFYRAQHVGVSSAAAL
jgi:hypothetical protein